MCHDEEETVARMEEALVRARSDVEDKSNLIDHFHKEMLKMQQGGADNTLHESLVGTTTMNNVSFPGLFQVTCEGQREKTKEGPTQGL